MYNLPSLDIKGLCDNVNDTPIIICIGIPSLRHLIISFIYSLTFCFWQTVSMTYQFNISDIKYILYNLPERNNP